MADEQWHEWTDEEGRRFRVIDFSVEVWWEPQETDDGLWAGASLADAVGELLRLAARERELLALTGKQHAALVEADSRWNTIDNGYCAVCRCGHRRYVGRTVEKGPCSNPACFSHELTALLASPDAQKAARELEELRTERDELRGLLAVQRTSCKSAVDQLLVAKETICRNLL